MYDKASYNFMVFQVLEFGELAPTMINRYYDQTLQIRSIKREPCLRYPSQVHTKGKHPGNLIRQKITGPGKWTTSLDVQETQHIEQLKFLDISYYDY